VASRIFRTHLWAVLSLRRVSTPQRLLRGALESKRHRHAWDCSKKRRQRHLAKNIADIERQHGRRFSCRIIFAWHGTVYARFGALLLLARTAFTQHLRAFTFITALLPLRTINNRNTCVCARSPPARPVLAYASSHILISAS